MPRYKITIEYDGTPFVGWQRQDNGPSVQAAIERAIEGFCGEAIKIRGAGRTDAGVHATGQVAHFDLSREWPADTVRDALNHHLKPDPVAVIEAEPAADDFDARFSATKRHYLYRILDRRAPPVLDRDRVWWVPQELDWRAMHWAAQVLVGNHVFTTFRAAACQAKSPQKTLDKLAVHYHGDCVEIRASARSFLHNQVRSIAGSLKLVGEGKWTEADLKAALEARDRTACGPVAPAAGLYLTSVEY